MNFSLPFIALDLETTGLDPTTDTIIEIAATRGIITRENGVFVTKNLESRTMLVNPGQEISEEVILITHIHPEMLINKPQWKKIRDTVKNFIPENAIILGHNVIFDVQMLETHGIKLSNHPIFDTFEFSEVFSQKAESLNLGFLADFYQIQKQGQEHRALTDVNISIELALYYLNSVQNFSENEQIFWENFAIAENGFWNFLRPFFSPKNNENTKNIFLKNLHLDTKTLENCEKNFCKKSYESEIFSLEYEKTEVDFIREMLKKYGKIHLVTAGKKRAFFLEEILKNHKIDAQVKAEKSDFLALDSIFRELCEQKKWNRKYWIFLIKMGFWTLKTPTGNSGELKYYGPEYQFLEPFRLRNSETNRWESNHQKEIAKNPVIISPWNCPTKSDDRPIFFRDITSLEEYIRKNRAQTISFDAIFRTLDKLHFSHKKPIIDALRFLESVHENIPDRPEGENPIPPGKYGETYFFRQKDFWKKGGKWLVIATFWLENAISLLEKESQILTDREEKNELVECTQSLKALRNFQKYQNDELVIVLQMIQHSLQIKILPRCLNNEEKSQIQEHTGYGFHLSAEKMTDFLAQEMEKNITFNKKNSQKYCQFTHFQTQNLPKKTLILTTSMKHIRELGKKFENSSHQILLQGTSGGKAKMRHYFLKNPNEKSVLIGLIDSWNDEIGLFEYTDAMIIAKVPFDPPTDMHFLAKTVGMKNSFENYSKPIVLSRLNNLIGNAITANKNIKIFCCDERIQKTEWGKFLEKNLY